MQAGLSRAAIAAVPVPIVYIAGQERRHRGVSDVPNGGRMGKAWMRPAMRGLVAARFKALAEPARLDILAALRKRELTVGELIEETGLGQANVSKHLQLLHALGFVSRRKAGLFVYYGLADRTVFQLCDLMCDRIEAQTRSRRRRVAVQRAGARSATRVRW